MSRNQKPELLPSDLCCCFFTKTMALNTHYRRSAFEERFTADTAIFHCIRTMSDQGPDERDVLPELCRPGRDCHTNEVDPT